MNILFYLNNTFNSKHGGIANVSRYLGNALKNKGHHVIYLSKNETSFQQVEYQFYLPNPHNAFSENNRQYFHHLIKKFNINIIINQNGTTPQCYEAALWGYQLKIPVITVLHSSLLGIYSNQKWLDKLNIPSKIRQNLSLWIFHKKYDIHYHRLSILSTRIVTLSEKFFNEVISFSGKEVYSKLCAIPNPCTFEGCNKVPLKNKELVYVGRLSYEKQVPLLLQIWAKLENKNPEWTLKIVGDGIEMDKCRALVSKLNLQRVAFVGHKDDPTPFYRSASIFCMTSRYEGFGLVLVEAMSYYTVPLAFNSYANASDIINNGVCGYLIPPFDIDSYVERLQFLMNDNKLLSQMGTYAKQQSLKYSIDKIVQMWEELFKNVTNPHIENISKNEANKSFHI